MNLLRALYFFAFSLVACSQSSMAQQYLYYFDKDMNLSGKEQAMFNGIGMHEDSTVKLILIYASNKTLLLTEHFTDSTLQIPEGVYQSYYKNVAVNTEGSYRKGKKDGLWQQWDSLGNTLDSSIYNDGGMVFQASSSYRTNGSLEETREETLSPMHSIEMKGYDSSGSQVAYLLSKDQSDEDKVFTRSEIEPSFPGGTRAWNRYVKKYIADHPNATSNNSGSPIICQVRFIVDKQGNVTEAKAVIYKDERLARAAIDMIVQGPKWLPAMQNGRLVKAYKLQAVTFPADQ
jgi:Gram-negative bacterial TonB protein C-terminal